MDGSEQSSPAESGTAGVPKSKNVRSSCDLCKRMKIKCDWQGDSCKHCVERGVECTVTSVEKKKRVIKRTDYLAALEDRINQMEAAITAAHLADTLNEHESIADEIGGQAGLSDRMSTLLISEEGTSQFIGASSGFSLFSPRGLQWITKKLNSQNPKRLIKAINEGNKILGNFATLIWRSMPDEEHEPLPSKAVADRYVDGYFQIFNPIFPVYEESSFRMFYEQQYSANPPTSIAWYASLNAVLALGSAILKDRLNKGSVHSLVQFGGFSHEVCWKYFRNASSKFTDLIFDAGEIMAIQAILCMTLMCQCISDPQPSYILVATAVRLSHAIGLHRSLGGFGLNTVQMKERQNVLWITYMLDVGISLRTGRPPAMTDQNIAVALPRKMSEGYDHFRYMATLALLESRIYSELYSAKAETRSGLERLKSIGRLDTELTQWRDNLPQGYRPESEITCPAPQIIPVTMLHFAYYNCLTAIHRASIHHGSWTSEPNEEANSEDHDEKLNPRVYVSFSLCLGAARNVIGLLKHFNQDSPRHSLILMAIYYPLTAALVLFANVLHNPQSPEALSDIELMGLVTAFLSQSMEYSQQLEDTIKIFAELHRLAGLLVRETQMKRLTNLKRRYEESADSESQTLPSTYLRRPSANPFAFQGASSEFIPSPNNYLYTEAVPFDQSQEFFTANNSFSVPSSFQYNSVNVWTEQAPDDFFADGNFWNF